MHLDQTTYYDLSIFNRDEEFSLFHRLDFTTTAGGKEYLRKLFSNPLTDTAAIARRQEALQYILNQEDAWPQTITNGTLVVIDNYLNAEIAPMSIGSGISAIAGAYIFRTFYAPNYGFIKFSFAQLVNMLQGFKEFIAVFLREETPAILKNILTRAQQLLNHRDLQAILDASQQGEISIVAMLQFDKQVRKHQSGPLRELADLYKQLDAYYSMAQAMRHLKLQFPTFVTSPAPYVHFEQLYHLIIPHPVAYDIELSPKNHFLFLTGANMAGKTTFIKAIGVAVFMAHLGMGVPAQKMELSFFDGILSNIQVQDNIFKGESYFYNEVQRIKKTVLQISNNKRWLVLIDEMFKGTNVEDAKNCSLAVIRGLLENKSSLYILSTHLYEIAEDLQNDARLLFKYFASDVIEDNLQFTYELRDGIAKEKLGYLILKREKVLDLLAKLGTYTDE
ncbi:MutS domain III [Chitinophaga costaii]|uniref:MutS domain III n=1 Tax=Chitinophaga costaii TaxID=1335309 RepID=A0A1C4BMS1_9BACT|nr:DNA mismatch repair protein MutS [Chitinophaga costaii]PUZ27549.1 DNA mismatch repair protein MutS [Chitinophaga costaii]SCC08044.1 MutS domain III [Chitinophaga costaii]